MSDPMMLISALGFGAGVFFIYKTLTYTVKDPEKVTAPKNQHFFADDPLTAEMIKDSHILSTISVQHVTNDIAYASICNGIVEVNPKTLAGSVTKRPASVIQDSNR